MEHFYLPNVEAEFSQEKCSWNLLTEVIPRGNIQRDHVSFSCRCHQLYKRFLPLLRSWLNSHVTLPIYYLLRYGILSVTKTFKQKFLSKHSAWMFYNGRRFKW